MNMKASLTKQVQLTLHTNVITAAMMTSPAAVIAWVHFKG